VSYPLNGCNFVDITNKNYFNMSTTVLHKADTGHADHGLNAYHSFSFVQWYNPERVQFVPYVFWMMIPLQPEWVFTHPHDNMEIITIPLEEIWRTKTAWKYRNHPKWRCAGHECENGWSTANSIQTKTNELNCYKFGFSKPKCRNYQQITLDPEERNNNCNKFFHQM
jgi:hypothetical protein